MSNFEIAAIIRELESYGFRALPASRERKCPVGAASWSVYRAKPMSEEEIAAANGDAVCILLGKCSGNAEVLDFDDEDTWSSWRRAMQQSHPALLDKLVWERTRNGGRHVLYRCPVIQGSRKLAKRIVPVPGPGVHPTGYGKKTLDAKLQPDGTWAVEPVLIETKGEGGLIICAPTPGYEWESGIPLDAPTLSPEERGALLSLSRSFSEVEIAETQDRQLKGKAPDFGSSPHAYDQFNQNASLQEVIDLLAQGGWAQNGENTGRLYFTRAGKDSGTSATLTKDAPHIFFVFTESDSHFAANSSITPFQLLVAYKHDNNRDAALEEIRDRGFKPNLDMLDSIPSHPGSYFGDVTDAQDINPAALPKRQWVLGYRLIKSFMSLLVAPGGVSKSTLSMLDCISIASNKPLSGSPVHIPGNVFYYNAEDPQDEIDRRFAAAAQHYRLDYKKLPHHIKKKSGRNAPLFFVNEQNNVVVPNEPLIREFKDFLIQNKCVAAVLDPVVRLHTVNENDSLKMDRVAQTLASIADETGCAIYLVHHTRKLNGEGGAGNVDTSRGSSALPWAARVAHTMSSMNPKEAKSHGVSEDQRCWYVRLDEAKSNLAPPSGKAEWFKRVSVMLSNGDSVGVLEPVKLAEVEDALTAGQHDVCQKLIEEIEIGKPISLNKGVGIILKSFSVEHLGLKNDGKDKSNSVRRLIESALYMEYRSNGRVLSLNDRKITGENGKKFLIVETEEV